MVPSTVIDVINDTPYDSEVRRTMDIIYAFLKQGADVNVVTRGREVWRRTPTTK